MSNIPIFVVVFVVMLQFTISEKHEIAFDFTITYCNFNIQKNLIISHLSFLRVISPCSGDASWPIYSTLHLPCARHPFSSIITIF